MKDVQEVMGFENPQAIYKWLSGKSLPSLDNFIILSRILNTSIEDILVVDGDIFLLLNHWSNDRIWSVVYTKDNRKPYEKPAGNCVWRFGFKHKIFANQTLQKIHIFLKNWN
ncbi:MAG: helix-turn-helix transcriptional regulator [Lachnospiraceae bacterium]|nr:helix-turn-helix transcriptional regulator [Lachnospiraceae bacterium]